jgi:nitrogen fixation NifU-like protein
MKIRHRALGSNYKRSDCDVGPSTAQPSMIYSPRLLEHFHHPRHAGEILEPNAVAEATNPICGDVMKLWLRVREGRVTAAGFKAAGCVPVIACGSWLAEWISAGRSFGEASALSPDDIENGLDGLPAASKHASELAIDVLRKALGSIADSRSTLEDYPGPRLL